MADEPCASCGLRRNQPSPFCADSGSHPQRKMVLGELVRVFLTSAFVEPSEPPRQQYRQRENRAQVIGFHQAQEHLRHLLKHYGAGEDTVALAEVRDDKQLRPMQGPGGMTVWVI